jgi:hypothetical protein
MNERIHELAEQAQYYAEYTTPQGLEWFPMFKERFAELIVRECATLLFNESERLYAYSSECDNMRHSDEAELCAEKCVDLIAMIEQHFGVEE